MKFKEYLLESGQLKDLSFLITEGKTNANLLKIGKDIAARLRVHFNGWWKDMGKFVFTDMEQTGTTFTAKDFNEAQQKLIQKRKDFANTPKFSMA
jgi:hypothetical protein